MKRYLSKDEILFVNFNTYKSHGGFYTPPHNIKHDGNKRTGLGAAILFLRLNGFRLDKNIRHIEITDFILKVASGEQTLEECRAWFAENIVEI